MTAGPCRGVPHKDVPREDVPRRDVPREDESRKDEPREDEPREDEPREDVRPDLQCGLRLSLGLHSPRCGVVVLSLLLLEVVDAGRAAMQDRHRTNAH